MARNKITDEKLLMQYFREKHTGFPKGKLIKSESPDFTLKISPKRSTGIEITQLCNPSTTIHDFSHLITEIENTISNKNDKLSLYNNKRLNEYWLLITVDSLDIPSNFNTQEKLDKLKFITGFDKVYLFDLFKGKITELRIAPTV